jgi:hypothetical protein
MRVLSLSVSLLLALAACKGDVEKPTEVNENEVITTVVLTLTPTTGGSPVEVRWADPENDGSPVIDPITLTAGTDYDVAVEFLNELEDPPEDITLEVDEESDQHQVFFTGSVVGSAVTYTYADTDVNGFPVGLSGTLGAVAAGSGTFTVTLRHMPPEDGVAVKEGGLAEVAASDGIEALPGDTDASVDFDLTVE